MVEMMVAGIMNLMSQDLHVSEAVVGQLVTSNNAITNDKYK
jgi:DHA1 family purine base/nucleoside efflux pump-like MFS transporter